MTRWRPQQDAIPNQYIFAPGSSRSSIAGFEVANNDYADLRGFGLADFAALQPYMSQVGGDTFITLNGADILTLKNIVAGAPGGQRFPVRLSGRRFAIGKGSGRCRTGIGMTPGSRRNCSRNESSGI